MSAGLKPVLRAIQQRVSGERPGVFRSLAAAVTLGITVAVIVYRLLRRDTDD